MSTTPAPTLSPILHYLQRLHQQLQGVSDGDVARYIPELAKANPAHFGIALATVDGQVYEVGDTRQVFTMQSISKPLVYGMALEDRGAEHIAQRVGVEPSGDAFNSIRLEPGTGRPLNPMVNAGAIAIASCIGGSNRAARLDRVLKALSLYAGRALTIDDAVFESERLTGHRNRAIAHLLRNYDILDAEPDDALDLYFRQCSVLVDCRDLALTAATLANGGTHPRTGQRAIDGDLVDEVLSVMTTCGMYDGSGKWVHRVGLPAKSGVGGGIIAVLPGQLGIAVYSPLLDGNGNSVRGVRVCQAVSSELGLHFLRPPRTTLSTVRACYRLGTVRSKRRWAAAASRTIEQHGHRVEIIELQGELNFASVEPVLRRAIDDLGALEIVVLDFKRVARVDAAAVRMLAGLVSACATQGAAVVLTRVQRGLLGDDFGHAVDPRHLRAFSFQPQLDAGLEWCERQLISRHGAGSEAGSAGDLASHDLCRDMSDEDIAWLEGVTAHEHFEPGSWIVRRGDPADALYFLVRGEVSVIVPLPGGSSRRLVTLSGGMGFGESAVIAGGQRSADVRADSPVECRTLRMDRWGQLERERPGVLIRLLHNLLRVSNGTAARLTAEVAALDS